MNFKNTDAGASPAVFTKTAILLNQSGTDGKRTLTQVKSTDSTTLAQVIKLAGNTAEFLSSIDLDDDGRLDLVM